MTEYSAGDVRDLVGMRTTAARVIVGLYAVVCVIVAVFGAREAATLWPFVPAVLVCCLAAYALIVVPGDPLPWSATIPLTAVGAMSCALVFAALPVPPPEGVALWWPMGMSTMIFTFMCVRGRTLAAWIGVLALIATSIGWAQITGQGAGHGLAISITNAAPVLMSTFFAWTLRPLARSIYLLRETSLQRSAEEAAAAAALAERDAQLARLDALARPLLERIASGEGLGPEERRAGVLLEAHLRDGLRAPVLQTAPVVEAVADARGRGVDVVMLDDHGMDTVPEPERDRIRQEIVSELRSVASGSVTVRVLPPGRRALVTILVRDDSVRRIELGHRATG